MRCVSSATCTSAEPVSLVWSRCFSMTAARSASARAIATSYLFLLYICDGSEYTVFPKPHRVAYSSGLHMSPRDVDRLRAAMRLYLLADTGLLPPDRLFEVV